MITKLLYVQPSELKFPCFEAQLNKVSTCWLQLTNRTDHNVAFKVKTTHPKKYCVKPNVGIVSPWSTRVIRVSMQGLKESVLGSASKDKFLIQSVTVPIGLNVEDITSELFRKGRGDGLEEHMLRVAYVKVNPPSPIPEASEEEYSPEASEQEKAEHEERLAALLESATMWAGDLQDQFSEASTSAGDFEDQFPETSTYASEPEDHPCQFQDGGSVSKLVENQEVTHELGMARRQTNRSRSGTLSILVLLFACFVGFVIGYSFT